MMGWFGPKLEPGERVVLRRSGRRLMLWLAALLLFVFLPLEFGLFLADEADGLSLERLLVLAPVAAVSLLLPALPLLFGEVGWKLAVTNRRLLHRPNGRETTVEEIPIAEIETVRQDIAANRIVVQGGPREISLDPDLIKLTELDQAIERAREAA